MSHFDKETDVMKQLLFLRSERSVTLQWSTCIDSSSIQIGH